MTDRSLKEYIHTIYCIMLPVCYINQRKERPENQRVGENCFLYGYFRYPRLLCKQWCTKQRQ